MAISQIQVRENPIVFRSILGYFSCLVIGWALLQLPLSKVTHVSGIDSLFTAASAISSTGLVSVDIGKSFSVFGQLILLLLIQLGGIAYLVLYSYVVLNIERKILIFREKDFSQIYTFKGIVKQSIKYAFLCEMIGAILLYFFFNDAGMEYAFWNAIFHSISSFCTAGFSLFSSNLESYNSHLGINAILCILSFLGAIGFFLWMLILKRLSGSSELCRFASRISQSFTSIIILGGAFLFLLTATFSSEVTGFQKVLISVFQTISAATTVGFNTIDLKTLPQITQIVLVILMLYGVCLTGSCLNMKGVPLFTTFKLMMNRRSSPIVDRDLQVFFKRVQLTTFVFGFYLLVLFVSSLLLATSENLPLLPVIFEAASALCTVGLSLGITAELSVFGKWLILLLMLVGRTGILILSFVFASQVFLKQRLT